MSTPVIIEQSDGTAILRTQIAHYRVRPDSPEGELMKEGENVVWVPITIVISNLFITSFEMWQHDSRFVRIVLDDRSSKILKMSYPTFDKIYTDYLNGRTARYQTLN